MKGDYDRPALVQVSPYQGLTSKEIPAQVRAQFLQFPTTPRLTTVLLSNQIDCLEPDFPEEVELFEDPVSSSWMFFHW